MELAGAVCRAAEERERYEKRSAEEKVLMAKDLAASHKKMLAGGGLGAYWKVREQIESFANRSPNAFVQLMERIAIGGMAEIFRAKIINAGS